MGNSQIRKKRSENIYVNDIEDIDGNKATETKVKKKKDKDEKNKNKKDEQTKDDKQKTKNDKQVKDDKKQKKDKEKEEKEDKKKKKDKEKEEKEDKKKKKDKEKEEKEDKKKAKDKKIDKNKKSKGDKKNKDGKINQESSETHIEEIGASDTKSAKSKTKKRTSPKKSAEPNDYIHDRDPPKKQRDITKPTYATDNHSLSLDASNNSVTEEGIYAEVTGYETLPKPKPAPRALSANTESIPSNDDDDDYIKPIYSQETEIEIPKKPVPRKRTDKNPSPPPLPASRNKTANISQSTRRLPPKDPQTKEKADEEEQEDYDDTDTHGCKVVIAIDFGTTFSGYAYSHTSTKDNIHMNDNWHAGSALYQKTPTTVVIDENGEFQKFGFEAQDLFLGSGENEDRNVENLHYYEEFKLMLMKEDLSEHTMIKTDYGKPINAVQLFAEVLKFFKGHIMKKFSDQGYNYNMSNIRWVLTVPAIWENNQKFFMRRAATEAGLINHVESTNLLIALEPEAASLYCRSLKMNGFEGCTGNKELALPEGSIYIVVDAGGGTIDITVHKIIEGGKTAEVDHAKGGPWGGSKVNGRFQLKMKAILGEDFVDYCKKENAFVWLELVREFELAKQSEAANPNSNKPLVIPVKLGLANCYAEFKNYNETIETAFRKVEQSGIKLLKSGKIQVDRDNVREIFKPIVFKTTDLLKNLLQKPKIAPAETIFIVGGFGQCPYLQEEIKASVTDRKRKVLIPAEGNLCVLRGAVMFGHQPDFIAERVAKYTYAYLSKRKYEETTDEGKEKFQSTNGEELVEYLETIIQKDDHIGANQEIIKDFPVDTDEFTLDIYSSEEREVDDPNSSSAAKKGTLKISLPRQKRLSKFGESETVRVVFKLGTELTVKGIHMESKTSTQTTFALLD